MGVSSGRSRVADIAFQVFGRAVHPDWYAVRAFRRIPQAAWQADVRIVEGGHAVTWGAGSTRLTEVLCGPETSLPDLGLLFHSPIRQERSVTLSAGSCVEYQSCFEAERVQPEVFAHLSEELTLDGSRGGLFHRFARTSRMAPPPLSLLRLESTTRGLSVQAIHTFPDERAIVRTQSLFEVQS